MNEDVIVTRLICMGGGFETAVVTQRGLRGSRWKKSVVGTENPATGNASNDVAHDNQRMR